MPIKQKFQPKIPPHHLYCPICGDKARLCEFLNAGEDLHEAITHKHCDKCGANWIVKYDLVPKEHY